ncbi:hypothetical protein [Thioclava pacifica]|uniref:Peptidase M23 n=1 Tax=Thioclava pacifica DSM 10166 TaxID=1353537 RepID=A0A074J309_9RHOB|nr:hypothetical protein [Thioclava pacifica]KEO50899.1 hypothetical protein TP2_13505 [Thioclava pacifica DSM 10166]
MKPLFFALLAMLAAGPALAHDGVHMHPHGFENVLALALIAAAVWGLVVVMKLRR